MSEALEQLHSIGVQKIHDKTHIPVEHIEAILKKNYAALSKVQFLGFVSILERDFKLDLGSLRLAGIAFFDEKRKAEGNEGVFIPQPKKTKPMLIYWLLGAAIVLFMFFANFDDSSELETPPAVDNSLIMEVKENIEVAKIEENLTNAEHNLSSEESNTSFSLDDENATQELQTPSAPPLDEEPKSSQTQLPKERITGENSLSVETKSKLWLGYIDLETNEHFQKSFVGHFSLDANRDWLLYFGHRFADIVVNGEKLFTSSSQRYLYKDGKLSSLSAEEFKRLNRGKEW